MRGTWSGGGTWQSSGGGFPGELLVFAGAVVAVGAAAATLAQFILSVVWVLVAAVAVIVPLAVVGLVLVHRFNRAASARFAAQMDLRRAALRLEGQQQQVTGSGRPALEQPREVHQHQHWHFHGLDEERVAELLRRQAPE